MDQLQRGYSSLRRCCLKRSEVCPNTSCVLEGHAYTSTALDQPGILRFKIALNLLPVQTCSCQPVTMNLGEGYPYERDTEKGLGQGINN